MIEHSSCAGKIRPAIHWNGKMMGLKDLQLVNGWEDIDRILRPSTGQSEGCEG